MASIHEGKHGRADYWGIHAILAQFVEPDCPEMDFYIDEDKI